MKFIILKNQKILVIMNIIYFVVVKQIHYLDVMRIVQVVYLEIIMKKIKIQLVVFSEQKMKIILIQLHYLQIIMKIKIYL